MSQMFCNILVHASLLCASLINRVFANDPGDRGSILGRVKQKTQKVVLCLIFSIIRCGLRVNWSNPGNGLSPSPTPPCDTIYQPLRSGRIGHKVNF